MVERCEALHSAKDITEPCLYLEMVQSTVESRRGQARAVSGLKELSEAAGARVVQCRFDASSLTRVDSDSFNRHVPRYLSTLQTKSQRIRDLSKEVPTKISPSFPSLFVQSAGRPHGAD